MTNAATQQHQGQRPGRRAPEKVNQTEVLRTQVRLTEEGFYEQDQNWPKITKHFDLHREQTRLKLWQEAREQQHAGKIGRADLQAIKQWLTDKPEESGLNALAEKCQKAPQAAESLLAALPRAIASRLFEESRAARSELILKINDLPSGVVEARAASRSLRAMTFAWENRETTLKNTDDRLLPSRLEYRNKIYRMDADALNAVAMMADSELDEIMVAGAPAPLADISRFLVKAKPDKIKSELSAITIACRLIEAPLREQGVQIDQALKSRITAECADANKAEVLIKLIPAAPGNDFLFSETQAQTEALRACGLADVPAALMPSTCEYHELLDSKLTLWERCAKDPLLTERKEEVRQGILSLTDSADPAAAHPGQGNLIQLERRIGDISLLRQGNQADDRAIGALTSAALCKQEVRDRDYVIFDLLDATYTKEMREDIRTKAVEVLADTKHPVREALYKATPLCLTDINSAIDYCAKVLMAAGAEERAAIVGSLDSRLTIASRLGEFATAAGVSPDQQLEEELMREVLAVHAEEQVAYFTGMLAQKMPASAFAALRKFIQAVPGFTSQAEFTQAVTRFEARLEMARYEGKAPALPAARPDPFSLSDADLALEIPKLEEVDLSQRIELAPGMVLEYQTSSNAWALSWNCNLPAERGIFAIPRIIVEIDDDLVVSGKLIEDLKQAAAAARNVADGDALVSSELFKWLSGQHLKSLENLRISGHDLVFPKLKEGAQISSCDFSNISARFEGKELFVVGCKFRKSDLALDVEHAVLRDSLIEKDTCVSGGKIEQMRVEIRGKSEIHGDITGWNLKNSRWDYTDKPSKFQKMHRGMWFRDNLMADSVLAINSKVNVYSERRKEDYADFITSRGRTFDSNSVKYLAERSGVKVESMQTVAANGPHAQVRGLATLVEVRLPLQQGGTERMAMVLPHSQLEDARLYKIVEPPAPGGAVSLGEVEDQSFNAIQLLYALIRRKNLQQLQDDQNNEKAAALRSRRRRGSDPYSQINL